MSDSPNKSQRKTGFVFLFLLLTVTASGISNLQSPSATPHSQAKSVIAVAPEARGPVDYRQPALRKYFQNCGCPAAKWADVFIREADRNELDWRLVASIAMIESTGGKHYKNRNILGWRSASQRFRSEPAGIVYVSSRLHNSPLYQGKSSPQILRKYNSERRNYAVLVNGVMAQLAAISINLERQGSQLALNTNIASSQPKS